MNKRFNVVIPKDGGGIEMYPMMRWLRDNPEHIPEGMSFEKHNSWKFRNALSRAGWSIQETNDEVRIMMPTEQGYEDALESVLGIEDTEEEVFTPEASFGLEHQLRDFIAQNLAAISVEGKKLTLYVDENGRNGIEYPTATGRIDILAVDANGEFVVFELKRAISPDYSIGQLSRYMGWIKQTIANGRNVHGVIVAKKISNNLKYAISVVPNVSLFEYEVSFKLNIAHTLNGD